MSAVNTKIELVTEAIEALTLAQCAALNAPARSHADITTDHLRLGLNVADARKQLAAALRELLTPTLRVVA